MRNALYLLTMLIITVLSCSFSGDNCRVNYEGIYAIQLDNEYSAVLRFYGDGTVLASTSVNDYMDVMTWFNKDNKDMVLKGKYKIKKCGISFSVSGITGEQEYEGEIQGNELSLMITDKESKKHTRRMFRYFAIAEK